MFLCSWSASLSLLLELIFMTEVKFKRDINTRQNYIGTRVWWTLSRSKGGWPRETSLCVRDHYLCKLMTSISYKYQKSITSTIIPWQDPFDFQLPSPSSQFQPGYNNTCYSFFFTFGTFIFKINQHSILK